MKTRRLPKGFRLPGDEPEPLLTAELDEQQLLERIEQGLFFESHAVAAFYRVRDILRV